MLSLSLFKEHIFIFSRAFVLEGGLVQAHHSSLTHCHSKSLLACPALSRSLSNPLLSQKERTLLFQCFSFLFPRPESGRPCGCRLVGLNPGLVKAPKLFALSSWLFDSVDVSKTRFASHREQNAWPTAGPRRRRRSAALPPSKELGCSLCALKAEKMPG